MADNKRNVSSINVKEFFSKEYFPLHCLIGLVVLAVAAMIVSIVVLSINPVVACLMVVLEAGLAACLNKIPLWIHGLVFIAQIVCGIMASQIVFMVIMALIYVFATAFLFVWTNR